MLTFKNGNRKCWPSIYSINVGVTFGKAEDVGPATDSSCFFPLKTAHDFADHCQLFSSNLVLEVVYGLRCKSVKDPYIVRLVQDVEEWTRSAEPGYHLVDAFPVLNKLPRFCRPWQRHGERLHANERQCLSRPAG